MTRILIILNNIPVKKKLKKLLEASNYEVKKCTNGLDALTILKAENFDLILSGIEMPGLDGYGLLHILNKDLKKSRIPFIFISENNDYALMRRCMNLGADDFFYYPIDDLQFLHAVENRILRNKSVKESVISWIEDKSDLNVIMQFKSIQKHSKTIFYKAKDLIYHAGDGTYYLYYINKGRVKTYLYSKDGKEYITGIFEEGSFFGYQAVFEEREHNQYAEAMEGSEIVKIDKQTFFQLILKNSTLSFKFLKMMSKNLTLTEEKLLHLAYSSVRKRLARVLLKYHQDHNSDIVKLSRTDLAHLIGTSTETLVRSLTEMKNSKLIHTNHNKITIKDLNGIKRMELVS